MKWKVCGMCHPSNIAEIVPLRPDYLGFIFYPKSPRYAAATLDKRQLSLVPGHIKKIGVFVNNSQEEVLNSMADFHLDYAQLHGDETPAFCEGLKKEGIRILKAFQLHDSFDFASLAPYQDAVSFFLFDTRGKNYGGNGEKFNWDILDNYKLAKPFFLSGGIGLEDIAKISALKHEGLYAIDVNSKFETKPGFKSLEDLKALRSKLMQYGFIHPIQ